MEVQSESRETISEPDAADVVVGMVSLGEVDKRSRKYPQDEG